MKKFFTFIILTIGCITTTFAMSNSRMREYARFLSDRMAYELNLSTMQYEDCYEINYDFIYQIDDLLDDMAYGYQDAIDRYYEYLDWRNDDLRMILSAPQFARFCALEYFYRPIYTSGRSWYFRIHQVYHNHSFYYYQVPRCYHTYRGAHSHIHHVHGFYAGRYHHEIAPHYDHFHGHSHYNDIHHGDFGHDRHQRPASHHSSHGVSHHNNAGHHDSPAHHDNHHNGNANHDNHRDNNKGSNNHRESSSSHRNQRESSSSHSGNTRSGSSRHDGGATRGERGGSHRR